MIKSREYRAKNGEKLREYDRKRGKIRRNDPAYNKKMYKLVDIWSRKNRDKLNMRRRQKRALNPFIRIYKTKEQLKEKSRLRNKKYYARHRERILKDSVIRTRNRMKKDVGYRLMIRMRFRLWHALKTQKVKKSDKTISLIGCTKDVLRLHLESKFKDGMNWNNYGRDGWSVDHILPVSRFDLSNKEEVLKAFHYSNLQPLWFIENIKKGNKIS